MINYSVIIPHHGQENYLQKCLQALLMQSVANSLFEVLVVNQSSSNKCLEIENYPGLDIRILTHTAQPNPYSSRNLGIEESLGKVLCFLDSRCLPSPSWLENGVKDIDTKTVDMVAGKFNMICNEKVNGELIHGLMYLNNERNVAYNFGVPAGNLFVRKRLFNELGLFPTFSKSGMDILWTQEALAKGYKLAYQEMAEVHYQSKSYTELKESAKKYAFGMSRIISRSNQTHTSIWKWFLPMRVSQFGQALRYRNLYNLSLLRIINLYILVWGIRIVFAKSLWVAHHR